MANRQPTTYEDWRKLWHDVNRHIGWHIMGRLSLYRPIQPTGLTPREDRRIPHAITVDRRLYELIARERRIHRRLELEGEVMDETFIRGLVKMLWPKNED